MLIIPRFITAAMQSSLKGVLILVLQVQLTAHMTSVSCRCAALSILLRKRITPEHHANTLVLVVVVGVKVTVALYCCGWRANYTIKILNS